MAVPEFFEKVRYRDQGKGPVRTVYLAAPKERRRVMGVNVLMGLRVGTDGEDYLPAGPNLMVITLGEIVGRERMEMDLHLGELVPEGTARIGVNRP